MSTPSSPNEPKEVKDADAPGSPGSPPAASAASAGLGSPTRAMASPQPASPKDSPKVSPASPKTSPETTSSLAAPAAPAAPTAEANSATSATPAAPAAPTAPSPAPTHPNPKVAALLTMFPSVDAGVVEMVLESVGGSQDRAIESLLQMTDPEFKPDATAAQTEETTSQLSLDEQFARALHMQEQEDLGRHPPPRLRTSQNAIPAVLPYQPRVRRPRTQAQVHAQQQQQQGQGAHDDPYADSTRDRELEGRYGEPPAGHGPGGDPPGMIAFEEKLGQFAEASKQTFDSLFTRAKAKYNEISEQHTSRKQGMQQAASEWREQGRAGAGGPIVGAGERKQYGGLFGAQRTSGEAPRATSPGERTTSPGFGAGQSPGRRWSPTDAYEDPTPPRIPSPAAGSGAVSPDKQPAPGKIDLSKLGFLPKKKVDLMSASTTDKDRAKSPPASGKSLVDQIPKTPPAELSSPHTLGDSDDDDDLEYTENPFERK